MGEEGIPCATPHHDQLRPASCDQLRRDSVACQTRPEPSKIPSHQEEPSEELGNHGEAEPICSCPKAPGPPDGQVQVDHQEGGSHPCAEGSVQGVLRQDVGLSFYAVLCVVCTSTCCAYKGTVTV